MEYHKNTTLTTQLRLVDILLDTAPPIEPLPAKELLFPLAPETGEFS